MVLLDTDHMSLVERGGAEGRRIWQRLRALPPDDVATTIVSFEEQTRGWLARIARATTLERQLSDYSELKLLLQTYCNIAVLDFDEKAAEIFERLRQAKIRIGTMDLKIAAIALANDATLLTRNLSDFGKVPDLKAEDWSL
jgi:tRNA(fMet)-specific endonuclease VapC